jgi:hypothetical protein
MMNKVKILRYLPKEFKNYEKYFIDCDEEEFMIKLNFLLDLKSDNLLNGNSDGYTKQILPIFEKIQTFPVLPDDSGNYWTTNIPDIPPLWTINTSDYSATWTINTAFDSKSLTQNE